MSITHRKIFLNPWILTILLMGLLRIGMPPAQAQTRLSSQSRVLINGIGPVQVGMPLAEANLLMNCFRRLFSGGADISD